MNFHTNPSGPKSILSLRLYPCRGKTMPVLVDLSIDRYTLQGKRILDTVSGIKSMLFMI